MKNLILTLISVLITFNAFSQSDKVTLYEKEHNEKSISATISKRYIRAVDDNGDSYVHYYGGYLHKISADMELVKEVECKYHDDIILMKNKGYLVYTREAVILNNTDIPDKKIFLTQFDKENMSFKNAKEFTNIDRIKKPKIKSSSASYFLLNVDYWGFKTSPNKEKLLFWKREAYDKENSIFHFTVFDEELNKIWEKKVSIKTGLNAFYLHDMLFTDDERIIFSGCEYDTKIKNIHQEWGKTDSPYDKYTNLPKFSNKLTIVTVNKEGRKINNIDFKTEYPIESKILVNKELNKIWIGGIYLYDSYYDRGSYISAFKWTDLELEQTKFDKEKLQDEILYPYKTKNKKNPNRVSDNVMSSLSTLLALFHSELQLIDDKTILMTSRGFSARGRKYIGNIIVSNYTLEGDNIYTTVIPHEVTLYSESIDGVPKFHTVVSKNGKVSVITFEDAGNIKVQGFESKRNELSFMGITKQEGVIGSPHVDNTLGNVAIREYNIVSYNLDENGEIKNVELLLNYEDLDGRFKIPLKRRDYLVNQNNHVRFLLESENAFTLGKIKL